MMSHFELKGTIVPMVTPLDSNGEVDVASLRRLVAFLIDAGVDALWVLGAFGQFHTLTERQRDITTEEAIAAVGGRVPVLVGCIDTSADRCIERARRARAAGANAVFATAPIFDAVGPIEVLSHFRRIHEAIDLPLVGYNAQYATQTPITFETIRILAEEGTLVGLKDSAEFPATRRLLLELHDIPSFRVVTGHTDLVDAALLIGAHGCVATSANVVPATYVALYRAAMRGDWATARDQQDYAVGVQRLVDAWGPGSAFGRQLGATKAALSLMGVISSANPGGPYPAPTSVQIDRIGHAAASLGLPIGNDPGRVPKAATA